VEETVKEIEHFYSNFVGFAINGERAVVTLRQAPTPEQLERLRTAVPGFDGISGYQLEPENTIAFDFDGRNYLNVRRVIDEVNEWVR